MKKIISILIIIVVLYILVIFIKPELAKSIWETLWLTKFNDTVINLKKKLDNPNYTESWSSNWTINKIVNWIDSTKEKIDNVRETANWVKQKYEQTKKVLNDVETLWNNISGLVNTWAIK